jgi:hypothetical protein
MKVTSLFTTIALLGLVTVWDVPLKMINPHLVQASAQAMKDNAPAKQSGETAQQKIAQLYFTRLLTELS